VKTCAICHRATSNAHPFDAQLRGTASDTASVGMHRSAWSVECPRCGPYYIIEDLVRCLERDKPDWLFRLSSWIRAKKESGEPRPMLEDPLERILEWLPQRGVREQLDDLLHLIESRTNYHGESVLLNTDEIAVLLWARNRAEVCFLLDALGEQGRIAPQEHHRGHDDPNRRARMAAAGLLHLEEIDKSAVLNDRIFVAMWFSDELVPAGNAICNAIRAAGYTPHLLTQVQPHGDRIDAKILVDIRRSRGLIVDVTGPLLENKKPCARPSVMYEGGFAEGLGKPVIWTVRKDQGDHLPFDTRQLLHVLWSEPADLAERLRPAIEARFGIRRP
jgi:hypothetical protein